MAAHADIVRVSVTDALRVVATVAKPVSRAVS
jgi:hypothetical protein